MTEELDPNSLSDRAVHDPEIAKAYERARTLEDLDVFDPEGRRLGRITRCFADVDEGTIRSCELRLDKDVKRQFDYSGDTVRVRHDWLMDVTADGARLSHAAGEVLGRTEPPGGDESGSSTFPRKTR